IEHITDPSYGKLFDFYGWDSPFYLAWKNSLPKIIFCAKSRVCSLKAKLGLFCQLNTCSTVIWHFKPRIPFKYGFRIAININEVGKMTANPEKEIPEYKKEGHVTYLKPTQQQPHPKPSLKERFKKWMRGE